MKTKEYKINTIQDIIDYTNEDNVDSFLADLKLMLKTVHKLDVKTMASPFIWIDDGINEGIIEIINH